MMSSSFHNCLVQNGCGSDYISSLTGTTNSFVKNEEGHVMEAAQLVTRPGKVWILIPASRHTFSVGYFCGVQ